MTLAQMQAMASDLSKLEGRVQALEEGGGGGGDSFAPNLNFTTLNPTTQLTQNEIIQAESSGTGEGELLYVEAGQLKRLPIVKGKFLKANAVTGNLEWAEAGGGTSPTAGFHYTYHTGFLEPAAKSVLFNAEGAGLWESTAFKIANTSKDGWAVKALIEKLALATIYTHGVLIVQNITHPTGFVAFELFPIETFGAGWIGAKLEPITTSSVGFADGDEVLITVATGIQNLDPVAEPHYIHRGNVGMNKEETKEVFHGFLTKPTSAVVTAVVNQTAAINAPYIMEKTEEKLKIRNPATVAITANWIASL